MEVEKVDIKISQSFTDEVTTSLKKLKVRSWPVSGLKTEVAVSPFPDSGALQSVAGDNTSASPPQTIVPTMYQY